MENFKMSILFSKACSSSLICWSIIILLVDMKRRIRNWCKFQTILTCSSVSSLSTAHPSYFLHCWLQPVSCKDGRLSKLNQLPHCVCLSHCKKFLRVSLLLIMFLWLNEESLPSFFQHPLRRGVGYSLLFHPCLRSFIFICHFTLFQAFIHFNSPLSGQPDTNLFLNPLFIWPSELSF